MCLIFLNPTDGISPPRSLSPHTTTSLFDFNAATTNTPAYTGSTNFYTNNVYTEASDPGVAGTQEASIRIGILRDRLCLKQ